MKKTILILIASWSWIVLFSCKGSNWEGNKLCSDYSDRPVSSLEEALIDSMIVGYRRNQLMHINEGMRTEKRPEFNDANSIWFDLETLKVFIYHIEKTKIQNPVKLQGKELGIHIYYSKYPKRNTWKNEFKEDLDGFFSNIETDQYEDLHTLVIIPAIKESNYYTDLKIPIESPRTNKFELLDENIGGQIPQIPLPQYGKRRYLALTVIRNTKNDRDKALNHGSLIPPGDENQENFGSNR